MKSQTFEWIRELSVNLSTIHKWESIASDESNLLIVYWWSISGKLKHKYIITLIRHHKAQEIIAFEFVLLLFSVFK